MKTLRVRYSLRQIAAIVVACFLAVSLHKVFQWGLPKVERAWLDPVFWAIAVLAMTFAGSLTWLASTSILTDEGLRTFVYPFKLEWQDVRKCKLSRILGIRSLKVYGGRSRFPLRIPLPDTHIEAVEGFMANTSCSEIVTPILNGLTRRST